MVADIDRFQQLVEDLLEISRFDAGVMYLDLEEVRVDELVLQAVQTSTDVDVPVDIDSDLAGVVVKADKRRLSRVIANLLDNAAKYGDGATRVELRKRGDAVLIAVEDDGPGVPDDDREAIFHRFNRGSSAGHRRGIDGVGLGLSLVAEHVRLHGGAVWVEDRADGRTAPASSSSCPRRRREPLTHPWPARAPRRARRGARRGGSSARAASRPTTSPATSPRTQLPATTTTTLEVGERGPDPVRRRCGSPASTATATCSPRSSRRCPTGGESGPRRRPPCSTRCSAACPTDGESHPSW